MEASMAETQRSSPDPEKREEAVNLAKEALEELQHGNKEEAKFLTEEARELDPEAVEAVLHDQDRQSTGRSKSAGQSKAGKSAGSQERRSDGSGERQSEARGRKSGGTEARRSDTSEKRGGS